MRSTLKSTLALTMDAWLEKQDGHDDRPVGLACPKLADMMADAAAAVYDASHEGSVAGAKDPSSCGVEDE